MKSHVHAVVTGVLMLGLCGCCSPREVEDVPRESVAVVEKSEAEPVATVTVKWYEEEIRAFEAADRAAAPAEESVLFVGSSSIRMWGTLAADMAPATVLNRGFGGSKTGDVLEVFDRIVKPYSPSVIVYYCGDNDLGTENQDAEGVAARIIEFDRRVGTALQSAEVMYIAIKPSLARWSNWPAMQRANELVKAHCERTPRTTFLDIATPMLGPDGKPDPSLFMSDGLHLNAKGYEVWKRVVREPVVEAWEWVKEWEAINRGGGLMF